MKRRKVFKDHFVSKSSTSIRIISSFSFFYASTVARHLQPLNFISSSASAFQPWEAKRKKFNNEMKTLVLLFWHQLRAVINLSEKSFFFFFAWSISLFSHQSNKRWGSVLVFSLVSKRPQCFFQWISWVRGKNDGKSFFTGSNIVQSLFLTRFSVERAQNTTKKRNKRQKTFIVTTLVDYKIKSFEKRVARDKRGRRWWPEVGWVVFTKILF